MNTRVQKLKDRLKVDRYPICAEKARLIMESLRRTGGEPQIVRRAKATAHYLDNRTIFIEDDELIVGNVASRPMGMEAGSMGPAWQEEDIENLRKSILFISDEDVGSVQFCKVTRRSIRMAHLDLGAVAVEDRQIQGVLLLFRSAPGLSSRFTAGRARIAARLGSGLRVPAPESESAAHQVGRGDFGGHGHTFWTNFAKFGHPNSPGLPKWPAFSDANPVLMYFAQTPHTRPVPSADALKVMDQYFAWRRTQEGEAFVK